LQETLFWLSQPRIHEDLAQARREYEAGDTLDDTQLRARLRLPKRS